MCSVTLWSSRCVLVIIFGLMLFVYCLLVSFHVWVLGVIVVFVLSTVRYVFYVFCVLVTFCYLCYSRCVLFTIVLRSDVFIVLLSLHVWVGYVFYVFCVLVSFRLLVTF